MSGNVHQSALTQQLASRSVDRKTRRVSLDALAREVGRQDKRLAVQPVYVQVRIAGQGMCAHVAGTMPPSGLRPAMLKLDTPIGVLFRPAYEARVCSQAGDGLCTCAAGRSGADATQRRAALTPPGNTGVTA